MLSANGVTIRFGKRVLFEDVNIKFNKGECYGIIGANGAGKSTFLKVLSGELEPSKGEVTKEKTERISVLKQDHFAFEDFTVMDTVIMGNKELYDIMKEKDAIYRAIQSFSTEFSSLKSRVDLNQYSQKLAEHSYTVLLKDENRVLGVAAMYINDSENKAAFITLIGIRSQFQKSGYGSILLQHCIEKAVEAGMKKIRLEVDNDNPKARDFYDRNGFQFENTSDRDSTFLIKELV